MDPTEITQANITWENDVDVISRVTADFPGFTLSSLTSMRKAPRQEVAFHGDPGVLRLTAPFNPSVFGKARVHLEIGDGTKCWRFPSANHYVNQVENFGAAVRGGAD